MKLKRLMALSMAAVMTLSLTACGGSNDDTSSNNTAATDSNASSTDNNAAADNNTTTDDAASTDGDKTAEGVPTIDKINVGEDYKDLTASSSYGL